VQTKKRGRKYALHLVQDAWFPYLLKRWWRAYFAHCVLRGCHGKARDAAWKSFTHTSTSRMWMRTIYKLRLWNFRMGYDNITLRWKGWASINRPKPYRKRIVAIDQYALQERITHKVLCFVLSEDRNYRSPILNSLRINSLHCYKGKSKHGGTYSLFH